MGKPPRSMLLQPAPPDSRTGWPGAGTAVLLGAAALVALRLLQRAHARVARLERRAGELAAARDAALHADREKSRFLATASHDLRQPVQAIGLFAATLQKRLEGHPEAPLIRNLSRAIEGLDRSFGVMLDFSRLNTGTVEPQRRQFPVGDLFRRLHLHFAEQAEQKGLGLRFSTGGKSIISDPQLLEQIVANLIHNAIKYTETGGIVVVTRSTARHHLIEVWDTGIGIREADLPQVFDEFFQVTQGRARSEGLGLGLSIVKRLAGLLGHELTVASRVGRGTRFRLAIARGDRHGAEGPAAPARGTAHSAVPPEAVTG